MTYPKLIIVLLLSFFSNTSKSQNFYKTPSGKAYHLSSCHMVKNVSREVSAAQAKEAGLQPCKICRPEDIYAGANPPKPTAGESKATVQCSGSTKKGSRCKHMTAIANGYCYQHQP